MRVYNLDNSFIFCIFAIIFISMMDELLQEVEYLELLGVSEFEAWSVMLEVVRSKVKEAYKNRDEDLINKLNKDIDIIQKQLIRLSQR
jgi:hypothetical protein